MRAEATMESRSEAGREWLRFLRSREVNPAKAVLAVAIALARTDCNSVGIELVAPARQRQQPIRPPIVREPRRDPSSRQGDGGRDAQAAISAERTAEAIEHFTRGLAACGVNRSAFTSRLFAYKHDRARVIDWMIVTPCDGEHLSDYYINIACGVSKSVIYKIRGGRTIASMMEALA